MHAQNFSFNCTRDTTISGCSSTPCFTLRTLAPDIRALSSSYTVNPINTNGNACVPQYSNPALPGQPTDLVNDDTYSGVIPIGFPFTFYGTTYNSLVVSSNGAISFDLSRAGGFAHYGLFRSGGGVLAEIGTPEDLPSALYDAAQIMGVYHDMDITINSSPNRRIRYLTTGAAPNRKWVISFFEIPLFNCETLFRNTHQLILNESTGIIEVLVFGKQVCGSWNGGRAMIGIQNATRDQGVMAPGRRASDAPWGSAAVNESWRFVPSGGASLFLRAELYELGNPTPRATITTPNVLGNGNLEFLFPNICPPAGATTTFIVKSVYAKNDDPSVEVAGYDTMRVTRTVATDLGATATATASACGTAGNGTITATVPAGNGSGAYQYSITSATGPWQPSGNFSNLLPGNYTVYVDDINGSCGSAVPVVVATTGTIPVNFTLLPSTCPGARNGRVIVNAGNSPNLEYRIGNNAWQSSNTFTGLLAGFYFISVRDNVTGCTATNVEVTVAEGAATVTGTATATATSCAGLANGGITVTATTGTGPYEYSVNNGTNWQSGNTFTGLAAGDYTVRIREAGVCISSPISVTIPSGSGLTPVVTHTATSCAGVNNGSITVDFPAGTTAPYTVVLDGTSSVVNNNTVTFNGIAAGAHSIRVTDATGCTTVNPVNITVAAGTGFVATIADVPTSCAGVNDGAIRVQPQAPGQAPFTATLMPGNIVLTGAGPFEFGGLAPGAYSVQVRDAAGCSFSSPNNLVVTAGSGLNVVATPSNASCTGVNNGSIAVTSNGTAPFVFLLDGTTQITSASNTGTFQNVAAGNHSITVTDANGCVTTAPVNVTVGTGSGITATHTVTNVRCATGTDGTIDVTIGNAGVAPYRFVLNGTVMQNGTSSTSFTGLTAGNNYSVVVTDALGCSFTINNISITAPAPLSGTATTTAVSCNGGTNGQISAVVSGGTQPYSYSIDNAAFQATSQFLAAAGSYTVYVRDANGCTINIPNVQVTEPAVLLATIASSSNATCEGINDGTIEVNVTGGTAPFRFSADTGATFQDANVLRLRPGSYAVLVRDANGCEVSTTGITIGLTNTLTLTPMADPAPVCEGSSIILQPVTNATVFSWTPAVGMSNASAANPSVSPATTTTYVVNVSLGQCAAADDVTVTVWPAPVANAGGDATICAGQDYQLQGSGGLAYSWSPATYLNDAQIASPQAGNPLQTTVYSLRVTDANNCTSLQADEMTLTVTPPIQINITPVDTVVHPGAPVPLLAVSPATNYVWTPSAYLDNPTIANPVFTAPGVGEVVTYQVTGTTDAGCRGEGFVTIRVYAGPELYVPTAFTPNGDGRNDLFFPYPVGVKKLDYFRVFNRWGQMIFSTSTPGAGWNGVAAGQDQPAGVYIWQVQAVMDGDIIIRKQGTVTLVR